MHRISFGFNWIRGLFPEFYLWASTFGCKPHRRALSQTGIRIVALGDEEVDLSTAQEDVWEAIQLLKRKDKRRFQRVVAQVQTIILGPLVQWAFYLRNGKWCVLNPHSLAGVSDHHLRTATIAAALVHEATHGCFDQRGIPFTRGTQARIERICNAEECRAFEVIQN